MILNCLLSSATIALLGVPFAARKKSRRNFWRAYGPWLYLSALSIVLYAVYIAVVAFICIIADAAQL